MENSEENILHWRKVRRIFSSGEHCYTEEYLAEELYNRVREDSIDVTRQNYNESNLSTRGHLSHEVRMKTP